MLAISTIWGGESCKNFEELIREFHTSGFDILELSVNITEKDIDSIIKAVSKRKMKITDLHNFCPIVETPMPGRDARDAYFLTSLEEEERKQAIKFTKRTIKYAEELGASAVVVHVGRVLTKIRYIALLKLIKAGKGDSKEFQDMRDELLKERDLKKEKHIQYGLKSLEELNRYAIDCNIKIGIETRCGIEEIPNFEEIGHILSEFKGGNIFYWHDVGHARIMEELGFGKHEDFLKDYGDSLLGVHIHDIDGIDDHKAPGQGKFDFSILKKYLNNNIIKVLEIYSLESLENIKRAKVLLESMGL